MAQSGYTPILIYASGTASNVPLAANMTSSASGAELALNYADGKLYYKSNAGVVTLLAAAAAATGTVSSVAQSFTGGLISVAGSPITTSGTLALTVAGTSGGIPYFSSASTWATSAALAASSLVVGGGAGAAPSTVTTGTGVVTALGVAVGTAGAFVVNGGALGTPSSGTVTNLTGTASININGTVGATTANTGAFTTLSATGVATFSAGTVSLPAITTTGDTNTGIFFPAADTIAFAEGGAEAMRIDSSGNVMVGATSPILGGLTGTDPQFTISGASNTNTNQTIANYFTGTNGASLSLVKGRGTLASPTATSSADSLGVFNFSGYNSSNTIASSVRIQALQDGAGGATYVPGALTFLTATAAAAATERMRIDSSGNLLVGTTTSPAGTKELVLGGDYIEGVVAIGTVTTSSTISLANGTVQTATLTASTACTFTMPSNVAGKSFVMLLKQAAATGNGTATFTSVKWGTAGAPTITATAGKMDILTFIADGTNWYGSAAQGYTP